MRSMIDYLWLTERAMTKDFKDNKNVGEMKTKLSYLAYTYVSLYLYI